MNRHAVAGIAIALVLVVALTWVFRDSLFRVEAPPAPITHETVPVAVEGRPPAPPLPPPVPAITAPLPTRPNLILVTVDTLRVDHLSTYGYAIDTTPELTARAAASGAIFQRAYATASWTMPSAASLLSSVLPSEHGAIGIQRREDGSFDVDGLPEGVPSLPAALHEAGYVTGAVVASAWFREGVGWSRGFDHYRCLGITGLGEVEPVAAEMLATLSASDQPFFLWVHVLDPHAPYAPPDDIRALLWEGERIPALDVLGAPEALVSVMHRPVRVDDLMYLQAGYDGEILNTFAYVERLLASLPAEPYVALVTSDHGEEFFDHRGLGHGHTLYEEVVHVPFVLLAPGIFSPTEVAHPVSLLDVLPTFVELAGGTVDPRAQGLSLLPLLRGEATAPRDIVFETGGYVSPVRGILSDEMKYGYLVSGRMARLFDLRADPTEHADLSAELPELAERLHARTEEIVNAAESRRPDAPPMHLTSEEIAQLRTLGYVH